MKRALNLVDISQNSWQSKYKLPILRKMLKRNGISHQMSVREKKVAVSQPKFASLVSLLV